MAILAQIQTHNKSGEKFSFDLKCAGMFNSTIVIKVTKVVNVDHRTKKPGSITHTCRYAGFL